ncbi:YbhB/YbcL family Raf kinase inhibitor-like protein [Paenibacillus aurantiacus]|uniref:YbhB/YbcL family Raf kinase inhibitor-like protein n=1 Tax=Paenibacillus aurantiacus TaxID=1936118 RepID=A0ABV5KHE5_9BACL
MSNNPFARMPEAAVFQVTSHDIAEGLPLPPQHYSGMSGVEGGQDLSPHLRWTGAPEGTQSFAVTAYDPDAPTGSGLWHWAVINIPASVTELPTGAGDEQGSGLPQGAQQLPNDLRLERFIGAAPPAGHGPHRYYFVVHALDVPTIGVDAKATPALLGFTMQSHTLGRAVLVATGERK